MQQRISQETKSEGTAVNKGKSRERTAIARATQENGKDNKNSHQNCQQQWGMWKRESNH